MRARAFWTGAAMRFAIASMRLSLRSSAARARAEKSARRTHAGFSVSTCEPASSAARIRSGARCASTVTRTTLGRNSRSISLWSAKPRKPAPSAPGSVRTRSKHSPDGSAAATASTPWQTASPRRYPSRWLPLASVMIANRTLCAIAMLPSGGVETPAECSAGADHVSTCRTAFHSVVDLTLAAPSRCDRIRPSIRSSGSCRRSGRGFGRAASRSLGPARHLERIVDTKKQLSECQSRHSSATALRGLGAVCIALALAVCASAVLAQEVKPPAKRHPFLDDPKAIAAGAELFGGSCAVCHGVFGQGGRGPDLVKRNAWHPLEDDALFNTIRNGVPAAGMPGLRAPDDDVWRLLAYVR